MARRKGRFPVVVGAPGYNKRIMRARISRAAVVRESRSWVGLDRPRMNAALKEACQTHFWHAIPTDTFVDAARSSGLAGG